MWLLSMWYSIFIDIIIALYNVLLVKRTALKWAGVFHTKRRDIIIYHGVVKEIKVVLLSTNINDHPFITYGKLFRNISMWDQKYFIRKSSSEPGI